MSAAKTWPPVNFTGFCQLSNIINSPSFFLTLEQPYQSCSRIFFDIVRHEGPRQLMKGLLPRLIAVPSMMSVFYVINEELEKLLLK